MFKFDLTLGQSDISGLFSEDIRYALQTVRRKTGSSGRSGTVGERAALHARRADR
jgi:hypothetical protein